MFLGTLILTTKCVLKFKTLFVLMFFCFPSECSRRHFESVERSVQPVASFAGLSSRQEDSHSGNRRRKRIVDPRKVIHVWQSDI